MKIPATAKSLSQGNWIFALFCADPSYPPFCIRDYKQVGLGPALKQIWIFFCRTILSSGEEQEGKVFNL